MSNNRQTFLIHVIGTLGSKLLLIILKMGMGILTARMLGATGRGLFFTSTQTPGLINSVGTLSIGEGLIYNIGHARVKKEQIFGTSLALTIGFSVVLLCFLFCLLPLLQKYMLNELPPFAFTLIFILLPLMMWEYVASSALRGMKLFSETNKVSVLSRSIILILIAYGLIFVSANIITALIFFTFGMFISAVIYGFILLKACAFNIYVDWKSIPKIIRFGGAAHTGTVLTEVEYRLDIFVLVFFLDAASVGIYSVGVSVAQILWYVSNSINTVLFPHLVKDPAEDRDIFYARVQKYTFYICLVCIIGLIVFGYPLIQLLYGTEFVNAYFVFLVLSAGLLADSLGRGLATWMKGSGRPHLLSWASGISLIVNIIFNFLLIPTWGIYGAAIASVISYTLRAIILFILFLSLSNVKSGSIFILELHELTSLFSIIRRKFNLFKF
jgi:O-antigen/teichoic acid export membrane protein